jgi:Domain of unknown function (DUF4062)
MAKKYQIFVSSTYDDLKTERAAVYEAILALEHIPVGMEYFGARSRRSVDLIKSFIDECDFQITIIGRKYGSLISGRKISYTEMEYDYAVKSGVPQLGFILRTNGGYTIDQDEAERGLAPKLQAFRKRVEKSQCAFWQDVAELIDAVQVSLPKEFESSERPGWVRGDQTDDYLARQLARTADELEGVKEAFRRARLNIREENRRRSDARAFVPKIGGHWQCQEKSATMEIMEYAGTISSWFETGTHQHLLTGLYVPAANEFQYHIWRREREANAAGERRLTVMFGRLHDIESDSIRSHVFASDGSADLQNNFTEHLTWRRVDEVTAKGGGRSVPA